MQRREANTLGQASDAGETSAVRDRCVTATLRPLGVSLRIEAAYPSLIAAVAAVCRGWDEPGKIDPEPLVLRLMVAPVSQRRAGLRISADSHRLRLTADGIEAMADVLTGTAECRLADAGLIDDPEQGVAVLEPLILFLLAHRERTPVHASAFVADGLAVLLAGPSGSGKSCLALAAHRAGYRLLSDDTVYVQLSPRLAVRGMPRPIHLYPDDAPDRDDAPTRLRNGKVKRAITLSGAAPPEPASHAVICLLERGSAVSLRPIDHATALDRLLRLEPGFDLLRRQSERVFERLIARGAWQLTLGDSPDDAIADLGANLAALAKCAA